MNIDLWDNAGAFYYRNRPERAIRDFFAEERDIVTITEEKEGWWLNDQISTGESLHPTLQAAKTAGDEILAQAEVDMAVAIFKEAGLQSHVWRMDMQDGLSFWHVDLPLAIQSMDAGKSWSLVEGDVEVGTAGTPRDLIAQMPPLH